MQLKDAFDYESCVSKGVSIFADSRLREIITIQVRADSLYPYNMSQIVADSLYRYNMSQIAASMMDLV